MKNAAVNIGYKVFMGTYVLISLGYMPTSGSAGSYHNSMFNNLRNFPTVFRAAVPFYILTSNEQGFNFLTSSSMLVITFLLCHPSGCEVASKFIG